MNCHCCGKPITQAEASEAQEMFPHEHAVCLDCATDAAADDAAESDPELKEWINS
jgi:hypothetical protein